MSRITPNDHNTHMQQQLASDASTTSSTTSSVRRFRLLREEEDEEQPSAKRYKTTGEATKLRSLKYGDKTQTNDEIHQSIELCPVMKTLTDTTVFQRLRSIHQLGTSEFVYMCGDHNRFQHSLGVAHLAEKLCKNIQAEQPQLGVSDKDVLCVKLAGLLHDVGHGPFSHLYEVFRHDRLPKYLEANPDLKEEYQDVEHLQVPEGWAHEDSSLIMVDAALEELGLAIDMKRLDEPLRQIGRGPKCIDATSMKVFKPPSCSKDCILTSRDFVFVKECIYGKPLPGNNNKFIGRLQKEQEWLYDIVNNRHNGLDVDKIDYYARDRNRTIGSTQIDIKMIEDARVAKGLCSRPDKCSTCTNLRREKHYMLCYPQKRVEATMDFFNMRFRMHSNVYQHRKTCSVGCMIMDIFCAADPFLRLKGTNGEYFPISRAANRSEFLLKLKDDVLALIEHSDDPRLAEAQLIYKRIREHNMYKCAVDKTLNIEATAKTISIQSDEEDEQIERMVHNMEEEEIKAGILNTKDRFNEDNAVELEAEDFVVEKFAMHRGSKDKNPLDCMRFFDNVKNERLIGSAQNLPEARPPNLADGEYDSIIPRSFQKVGFRLFVRDESKKGIVNQYFTQWFEGMKHGDVLHSRNTPEEARHAAGGHDEDERHHERNTGPVALSQDEEFEDYVDHSDPLTRHDDLSPVPVRTRYG